MTTSATPRSSVFGTLPVAVALVLALGAVGWAWAPVLSIPLSGEDYSILSRIVRGEAGTPQVYRPLLDVVLSAVHKAVGVERPWPYHAVALGLHVLNALLVFTLARELLRSSRAALAAALLFGLGNAATDALAWTAALNRPLSGFGALVALNGVVRLRSLPLFGACLAGFGLLWQFASNEEAYGTAFLVAIWAACVWLFPSGEHEGNESRRRPGALVLAVFPLALLAFHYFVLSRVPGGTSGVLEKGLGQVGWSIATRTEAIVAGFGLPQAGAVAVVLVAFCVLLFTGRRAGLLAGLFWLASFVPFALSDAVGYRFYPTQAPTALLVAGALFGLLCLVPETKRVAAEWLALVLVASVSFVTTYRPREERLASWRESLREIEACREVLADLPRERESMPVWVNLEATTLGLVMYHYGVELADLSVIGFLDGRTGYCRLENEWPEGPWFGRRCEGSYGRMDPELYFESRPQVPTLRLYSNALAVESLAEAREILTGDGVDLTKTVLAESPAELPENLTGEPLEDAAAPPQVVVLEPLSYDAVEMTGTMRVALRTDRPMILVYQENFLYQPDFHVSADQALITHLREVRERKLITRAVDTKEEYPTFYVNAFAWGTLLPAGEHDLRLDSYKVSSDVLR